MSDLNLITERLERERPVPAAGFRGELRRHLLASRADRRAQDRARFAILAYATGGTALMLIAVVGVLGAGPLAA